jgi:hypothetical protein
MLTPAKGDAPGVPLSLEDSRYLISPFVTTTHFKRERDGSKWNPQPCETLPPTGPPSRGDNVG